MMEHGDPGQVILRLLTLGGISLLMSYFGSLVKTPAPQDYLSQLPDAILFSILSLLPKKDAARTSILSTRWRYMFLASMPTLDINCLGVFGIDSFRHSCCPSYQHKFVKRMNQLLQLCSHHKVAEVNMRLCLGSEFAREFEQWMHAISRLRVERLCLFFDCGTNPVWPYYKHDLEKLFKFSFELLSQASSLKCLYLKDCAIKPIFGVPLINSLKTLQLGNVWLASGQLEGILSSCLNLSYLYVKCCRLPDKLCISGSVTYAQFRDCYGLQEINLQATNLQWVDCYFISKVRFRFSSVPMLKDVRINPWGGDSLSYIFGDFARDLPAQVESLLIRVSKSEVKYFPTKTQMFRNLRRLTFVLAYTDASDIVKIHPLLDACPLLQYLDIVQGRAYSRARGKSSTSSRSPIPPTYHRELKQVTFGGFGRVGVIGEEIEFAIFILKSAVILEQMFVSSRYRFRSGFGSRVVQEDTTSSLDEKERNSIQQELQGQAISKNVVVSVTS